MKKIKLAYNLVGTFGPASNIVDAYTKEILDSVINNNPVPWPYVSPYFYNIIDYKNNHDFEITTAFSLSTNDYFLYETQWNTYQLVDKMISCMPQPVIDGIRYGNGYLLINDSVDAIFYHMMDTLVAKLDEYEIPRQKIIYLTGSIDIDDVDNYWGINLLKPDWNEIVVGHATENFVNQTTKNYSKLNKFLSLNRMWHHHRVHLLYKLYKNNLLEHFDISFRKTELNTGKSYYDKLLDVAPGFFPEEELIGLEEDARSIDALLPMVVDDPKTKNMHESHIYELEHTRYYFNVVPETNFYNWKNSTFTGVHASEKIFKPILYKTPFIVIGPAGLLKALRKKGYKTFNEIIDEGYDDIIDDQKRFSAIIKLIKQLSEMSLVELGYIDAKAREICEFNFKRLQERGPIARSEFIDQLKRVIFK